MQQLRNSIVRLTASLGLFAGLFGLALTGCTKPDSTSTSSAKPGTVGIVDLDQVSKEVGWEGEIKDDRSAAESEIKSQFEVYAKSVQSAWTDRRKAIGEAAHLNADELKTINAPQINGDDFQKLPLSKDQKDEFLRSANEASQALQAAYQKAQQIMQQRNARVIDSYREAMRPSVRRVADHDSVTTVLPANVAFYYDASVDLSNQVVDDLRKAMPQHTMPPMPKLNYEEFKFTTLAPANVTAPTPPAPRTSSPAPSH